jgi:uncharacterized protein YbaR (Trm112 family)
LDSKYLDILACPVCKGPLAWHPDSLVFVCRAERLAYPVRNDVPVMLEDQARRLAAEDPLLAE